MLYVWTGRCKPFNDEPADILGFDHVLHGRHDALRGKDLPGFRLGTESRGEIGHGADRAIVPAPFESDGTDRRIALGDADAEREIEAALFHATLSSLTRSHMASAIRTARSAGLSAGTGSLKNTIMPSPVKRSSVPSQARMSWPIAA